MSSSPYFETFAQAIDGAIRAADDRQVLLAQPSEVWSMCQEPLNYNQVRSADFQIELLKGKATKEYFHVVISRLDSGRYELVTYVL